jgi:protein-L-isoaspartate(D-aspartate) O-methyltransferase
MAQRLKGKSPTEQSDAWLQKLKPANSNTRISVGGRAVGSMAAQPRPTQTDNPDNLGLTSERLRMRMVQRVLAQGVSHKAVLDALAAIPRHRFVDQALASRAYEDGALPIGHGQTISQPWVVARMLAALCEPATPRKVLEIGTGCGYQAAVMSVIFQQVFTVERIRPLYDIARERLQAMSMNNVQCLYGDGMLGWAIKAPFDAIVVAAAGLSIPQSLLDQLAVGGKLIAPEGDQVQRLIMVTRESTHQWKRVELEAVRFVPLKSGVQS